MCTSSPHDHPPPTPHLLQQPTPFNFGITASQILHHALKTNNISFTGTFSKCHNCLLNKSPKLPFSRSNISSSYPLEIVQSDVWGPAPFNSIDGFRYYVIFIDHFSKYVWFYPMKLKSDVSLFFPIFKNLVEKQFTTKIKTFYSDNGGEFIKLRSFFSTAWHFPSKLQQSCC